MRNRAARAAKTVSMLVGSAAVAAFMPDYPAWTLARRLSDGRSLRTQRPKPVAPPKPVSALANERASDTVHRAADARGHRQVQAAIQDSVSEGKLTLGVKGTPARHGATLLRKGDTRVQRIVKWPGDEMPQRTDGVKSWEAAGTLKISAAGGCVGAFFDSESTGSVRSFLDATEKAHALRDATWRSWLETPILDTRKSRVAR